MVGDEPQTQSNGEGSMDQEELQSLRLEVGQLKDGTLQLAEQVTHLTSSITAVNRMQREQRQLKQSVADVQERSATKEDLKTEVEERTKVHKVNRRRFILLLFFGVFQGFLLIAVGASYVDFRHSSYNVCKARSDQANGVRSYLQDAQIQALTQAKSDAERKAITDATNRLLQAFPTVDCSSLKQIFPH